MNPRTYFCWTGWRAIRKVTLDVRLPVHLGWKSAASEHRSRKTKRALGVWSTARYSNGCARTKAQSHKNWRGRTQFPCIFGALSVFVALCESNGRALHKPPLKNAASVQILNQVQHRLLTNFGKDEAGFGGCCNGRSSPGSALFRKTGRDERIPD